MQLAKLKVILRQKSWMKKSKLQATGLNYESAKRPKRFLNFLPPPISLGLSWREMTCDGDILFSERSPTKAPTPVPTQSFSPTAFDPQDGLSSFHQILPQEPSELTLFLVNFQFNQDSGFAYMVCLALASYYVYRKNMEPKLPKTCMGFLSFKFGKYKDNDGHPNEVN